jgi:hypothetical protein
MNQKGQRRMKYNSEEITNKMQPCNRIHYSTVHWRLNMFWAAYRSSSGALTVFAPAIVKSEWEMAFPLRLDYGWCKYSQTSWWWAVCRSKHAQPSMNGGIMNCITWLHLLSYFFWVILWCTHPWIFKKEKEEIWLNLWHYPGICLERESEENHAKSEWVQLVPVRISTYSSHWMSPIWSNEHIHSSLLLSWNDKIFH